MSETEQEQPDEQPDEAQEDTVDDETPAEPEPEQEDGGDQTLAEAANEEQARFDEREAEKGRKRIDRAVSAMVKTLHDVLSDEAGYLEPCPRCKDDFPGLIWQPAIKQVLPETRAAVMVSMGEDPDPILRQDQNTERCPKCDGYGRVQTGSRVARQDKLTCLECQGRGWVGNRPERIQPALASEPLAVAHENGEQAYDTPETDPWGRVKGEALYGVMPGFEQ